TKLAKKYKVTTQSIRRWIYEGKFEQIERTRGGHYRIWDEPNEPEVILYARDSSSKQKSSIEIQRKLLEGKYPKGKFTSDIGSGFNFKRRGFESILERSLSGEPIKLVVTTSDRNTRSGYPLVKKIIELGGGSIELLEEVDSSDQFDTKAL